MASEGWTREAIIFAIRRWVNDYGEPPLSKTWASNRRPEGFPTTFIVRDRFGSWNDAIRAAGYRARSVGAAGHLDLEYTLERLNDRSRYARRGR